MNPQAFNRYSYCLNNPLKYIDPSGHLTGTVVIDSVEYKLVDEGNGIHHLETSDGGVTASLPLAELIDLISGQMIYEGDFSHGGNVYIGAVVKIDVDTNLSVFPIPVYFVPEGSSPANFLENIMQGAYGISISYIGGVALRYQMYGPMKLENRVMHECWHYMEQKVFGELWYLAYAVEGGIQWALNDWNIWQAHDSISAEKRANEYADTLKVPFWFRIMQALTTTL